METHIALLRGINVAGQKKVPMAELRLLLEGVKFEKVQTYIQSGNVVFQSAIKDQSKLESLIQKAIKSHFGFEVPVLVIAPPTLKSILNSCPFSEENKQKSYFTLLKTVPEAENVEVLKAVKLVDEEIEITNTCVYFYSDIGYGKSKCDNNFIERKLKVNATTRNYKTMIKLIDMVSKN